MFLLVSVRHVGAHPGEHQHGVSIQISISLGKTFLRISRIRNIPLTWILARVFVYVPPFISRFWTLSIERFLFLFWSILNGVALKTSNISKSYTTSKNTINRQYTERGQLLVVSDHPWCTAKWSLTGGCHIILTLQAEISQIDIWQ